MNTAVRKLRQQSRLIDGSGKHACGAQRVGLDDEEMGVLVDEENALADVRQSRKGFSQGGNIVDGPQICRGDQRIGLDTLVPGAAKQFGSHRVLLLQHRAQCRELVGGIGDHMYGHKSWPLSFPQRVWRREADHLVRKCSRSAQNLWRQIFRYLEFDLGLGGADPDETGLRLRRYGRDFNLDYSARFAHFKWPHWLAIVLHKPCRLCPASGIERRSGPRRCAPADSGETPDPSRTAEGRIP